MNLKHLRLCLLAGLITATLSFAQNSPGSSASGGRSAQRSTSTPRGGRGTTSRQDTARKVYLVHANTLSFDEGMDIETWWTGGVPGEGEAYEVRRQVLRGDVVFRQDSAYMYCDLAYFYQQQNSFKAFGNVRMQQGDTLSAYCDSLVYDGDRLLGQFYDRVHLIHNDTHLYTDYMTYDRARGEANYPYGGQITDPHNFLESQIGWYYPNRREALFHYDVELSNYPDSIVLEPARYKPYEKEPQAVLYSDTLRYSFANNEAQINGPSRIELDTATCHTTLGFYNTRSMQSRLYNRSWMVSRGRYAAADTLLYDGNLGVGDAYGSVEMTDTLQSLKLTGDYAHYVDEPRSMLVTGRALAMEFSDTDTLYLHADTLRAFSLYRERVVPAPAVVPAIAAGKAPHGREMLFETPEEALHERTEPNVNAEKTLHERAELNVNAEEALHERTEPNVNAEKTLHERAELNVNAEETLHERAELNVNAEETLHERAELNVKKEEPARPVDAFAASAPVSPLSEAEAFITVVDTLHYMLAYHNVRYFRNDLQGICDSLHYSVSDSLATFVGNPVMWNEMYQITGDTIFTVIANGGGIDRALVHDHAFLTQLRDSVHFDQISGQHLICYFDSTGIRQMNMDGTVQIIYFPEESDGQGGKQLIGLNQMIGNYLTVWFRDRRMDRLRVWPDVVGSLTPIQLVTDDILRLDNFRWMDYLRPTDPMDVFRDIRMKAEDVQENVRLFNEDELNGY